VADHRYTDKQRGQVAAWWKSGFSARAIAEMLGFDYTRNMIIGLVHRMHLSQMSRPPVRRAMTRRRAPPRPPPPPPPPRIQERLRSYAPKIVIRRSSRNVTLFELEPHDCRWPVEENPFRFCGLHAERPPYCQEHWAMAMPHLPVKKSHDVRLRV
jgi:hypothetical protein